MPTSRDLGELPTKGYFKLEQNNKNERALRLQMRILRSAVLKVCYAEQWPSQTCIKL
jgi:hypothetical protein